MTKASSSWRAGPVAAAVLVATVATLLLASLAPAALAASKRRVGVSLNGMPSGPVREAIAEVLKHHGFEAVAPELSGESEDAIAAAAKQSKLAAVIVGEVREGGRRAKLRVYGASGDLIGEGSWSEKGGPKKLGAVVERTLWARVGGALSKAHAGTGAGGGSAQKAEKSDQAEAEEDAPKGRAPVEETPTYSRSKESDAPREADEGESSRKRKKKRPVASEGGDVVASDRGGSESAAGTALDLAIGSRFVSRSLAWTQGAMDFNPYSLGFAPSLGLLLAWYPAAHFMGGWASNLGLAASVEYIPGLVSQTGDGLRYPTQESDYSAGARGRLILGPVEGALTLGGGQHALTLHSQGNAMRSTLTGIPDTKYTYVRAGLDLRFTLPANFALMLGGGYRQVLSAGNQNQLLETSIFLPQAKVAGFDVMAAVGYRFLPMLEGRAGFDLRRYQITPGANNHMVTAGTDQYVAFWVQAALVLDGVAGGGGGGSRRASAPEGGDDEGSSEKAPAKKAAKKAEKEEDGGDEE